MNDFATSPAPATVRLERLLPGPIERVWAYLTEPEKRAKWFAGGPMELRASGKAELLFQHANLSDEPAPPEYAKHANGHVMRCLVTRCEPPRLLAYTWGGEDDGGSEVTFELSPAGDKVRLVLTHRRLPNRAEMVGVAGGWTLHVGLLEDVLEGRPLRPFWSTVARLEAEYEKRL